MCLSSLSAVFYIYGFPQVVGLPFVILLPFHFSSPRGGSWLNVDATLLVIKDCSCLLKMLIFHGLFTNYEFLNILCVPEHVTNQYTRSGGTE